MRIESRSGVAYTQAANCRFCLHVGSRAFFFGHGPSGRRLELFTPSRWFRWSRLGKRTDWKQEHDAAVRYHEGCRRMIHEALGEPSYGDCDIWEAMRRKIMELQKNTDPINTLK